MKAYREKAGEGYMPDCQLGKKEGVGRGAGDRQVKASIKERPLFQAG